MTANQIMLPLMAIATIAVLCVLIAKAVRARRHRSPQFHTAPSGSLPNDRAAISQSAMAGHLDGGAGGGAG